MDKRFIPNDNWIEEVDGYQLMLVCVPNTAQWVGTAKGAIYQLTRGRTWDEKTGNVKDAQAIAKQIWENTCMVCLDDLVVQVTRIADALQPTDGEGNTVNNLSYLQHLQTLGSIPGAGDTIQTSLQKAVSAIAASDLTLQDLIDEISSNPDLSDFKDLLEILTFIKNLMPNINLSLPSVMPLVSGFLESRYKHNDLTIKAYQATALRGIQNALTPFDGEATTEEAVVSALYDKLDRIPWLLTTVSALAELSEPDPPAEKTAVAKSVGSVSWDWLSGIWNYITAFWNQYADLVDDPVPPSTVTGSLMDISRKLARESDAYSGTTNPVSIFGMLQGLALTQLHDDAGNLTSSADSLHTIATALSDLDASQLRQIRVELGRVVETIDAVEDILGGSYTPPVGDGQ